MENAPKPVAINRWLPYWAVLQADLQQTFHSWVYRFWVLLSLLAAAGFLVYRLGLVHEAGWEQPASKWIAELFRWTMLGSLSLIVVLTAGTISSERGSMADSVLSRGISRYQYFLGKWHSRLICVNMSFVGMSMLLYLASLFLLPEDLSLAGCGMALAVALLLLMAVVSLSVAMSAICNSTLLSVALVWAMLYGGGFLLTLLPAHYITPDRVLHRLPFILQGNYDPEGLGRLMLGCLGVAFISASIGMSYFAYRDI
ncbi:MAG: ABC transporter permease [Gemmataceae bacterium]